MSAGAFLRRRAAVVARLVVVALLPALAGCERLDSLAGNGVTFDPPAAWSPVASNTWLVPGQPLGAWNGPGGASMVVYRSLGVAGATADQVLTSIVNRYDNLPETKVVGRATLTVADRPAGRLDAVAMGDGQTFAPTGMGTPYAPPGKTLIPTRRVLVTVPRADDTISIVWHAPESDAPALLAQVDSLLKRLRLSGGSTASQTY